MFIQKIKNTIKKWESKKGFIILIAIVVSSLLVSMGMFIANIAYKELVLSSSSKASQRAFFVADSVIECALRHDIRGSGFRISTNDIQTAAELLFNCNGHNFSPEGIGVLTPGNPGNSPEVNHSPTSATSVYFVSFAEGAGSVLTAAEIAAQPNAPYAKLIVRKKDIGTAGDGTTIEVFGHNKYTGVGQVERALEVTY